jgi:hypothetical protein
LWEVPAIPGLKDGSMYSGYAFMIDFDPEWSAKDKTKKWYRATVLNDDTIVIEVPGWRFSYLHDREELQKKMPAYIADELDDKRDKYMKDTNPSRHHKEIHLHFPSGHRLSAEVIKKQKGKEERLPVKLVEVKEKKRYYLQYEVARVDIKGKKKGKLELDEDEEDEVYKLIKNIDGMNILP